MEWNGIFDSSAERYPLACLGKLEYFHKNAPKMALPSPLQVSIFAFVGHKSAGLALGRVPIITQSILPGTFPSRLFRALSAFAPRGLPQPHYCLPSALCPPLSHLHPHSPRTLPSHHFLTRSPHCFVGTVCLSTTNPIFPLPFHPKTL